MHEEFKKLVLEFKEVYKNFCSAADSKNIENAIRHSLTLSGISSSMRTLNSLFIEINRRDLVEKSEEIIVDNVIPRLVKLKSK